MDKEKPTIILGVIGSDCHAVGNRILYQVFTDAGFNVVNLGVLTPRDDFVMAAVRHNAQAILVSSLYGHGEMDCKGMRESCREAGLGDIILYVGGNLTIGKKPFPETREKFLAMGYNRVFNADCDLDEAVRLLKEDLQKRTRKSEMGSGPH